MLTFKTQKGPIMSISNVHQLFNLIQVGSHLKLLDQLLELSYLGRKQTLTIFPRI